MQKIFYVNTNCDSTIELKLKKINDFVGETGKIITITSSGTRGGSNNIDWFIVASDGKTPSIGVLKTPNINI